MDFLKRNWWKVLPFTLFLFGLVGILLFVLLLASYSIYRFIVPILVPLIPINPKRGKLLTWLIILQVMVLLIAYVYNFAVIGKSLASINIFTLLLDAVYIVCLIGIWRWQKFAAIGLIVLLTFSSVRTTIHNHTGLSIYPGKPELFYTGYQIGEILVFILIILWLFLWIKALKQKWILFT